MRTATARIEEKSEARVRMMGNRSDGEDERIRRVTAGDDKRRGPTPRMKGIGSDNSDEK